MSARKRSEDAANAKSTEFLQGLPLKGLHRDLLSWYDSQGRRLPWRQRPSLYGTWISEIMLQQTTVGAVLPRWRAFMDRFPDVTVLAAAAEEEVLNSWRGLGYYRRARQLHAASRQIVAADDGELPLTAAAWSRLPGIGPYTAGAIASIACGERVAAVDTNVKRVLSRLICRTSRQAKRLTPSVLAGLATELVPGDRPGDWNQALMDLGAGVCRPLDPDCAVCPLTTACRAHLHGCTDSVPTVRKRPTSIEVVWSLLVMERSGQVVACAEPVRPVIEVAGLGEPVKTSFDRLYRGYSGLPVSSWQRPGKAGSARHERRALVESAWRGWLGQREDQWLVPPTVVDVFRHTITRHRLEAMVVYAVPRDRLPVRLTSGGFAFRRITPDSDLAPPALRAWLLTERSAKELRRERT